MKSRCIICGLLIAAFSAGGSAAENLKKSYCSATLPGTFAKSVGSYTMPDGTSGSNIYTYTRLTDSEGRVVVEVDVNTQSGPGAGSVNRSLSVMEKGFDLLKDGLEYNAHVEVLIYQPENGEAMLDAGNTAEIIRASTPSFRNAVTFKGSEKIAGRLCDHYSYAMRSGDPNPTIYEGEIWLDATVPFGMVKRTTIIKDASGKLQSTNEEHLVDSGMGASGSAAMIAIIPGAGQKPAAGVVAEKEVTAEAPQSVTLEKGYQSGVILLHFEAVPGSGGKRLRLTVVSQTAQALVVAIPKGNLALANDIPVETLNIAIDKERSLSLAGGAMAPPIEVGQTGKRGVTAGDFDLSVYDGQPLFSGAVEVGPLKQ